MRIQINATRIEFLRLRRRLLMAMRGHKLLKDKNEGLIKEFLTMVKVYKEARRHIDANLPNYMKMFTLAQITSSSQNVNTAMEQAKGALEIKVSRKNILNIKATVFEVSVTEDHSYSLVDTPLELDTAITQLKEYFPSIVRASELEQSIRLLAREIEKTRRRVNALEYVIIPHLEDSIKFIKTKLDEIERSNISRFMKIKEILAL